MNRLYGSSADGAADATGYAVRSTGVFDASSIPAGGLHDIYAAAAATCACFVNTAVVEATAIARITAHILALNAIAGRHEAGYPVVSVICLYSHDGANGSGLSPTQCNAWLGSNLPGWNASSEANYVKSAIIYCTAWTDSPAERYLGTIEGTVVPPFHYLVARKAAGDYRVIDKFHCGSTRNGGASEADATDTLLLDFMKPLSASDAAAYLARRTDDALDAAPTARVAPDTLWTMDAADGLTDPVARVTNGSSFVFEFSEKAVGPGDASTYAISGAPAGLAPSVTGLSPDTRETPPEGLRASMYILDTGDDDTKDRWKLTLHGLSAGDDGAALSIDASSIRDGAGNPIALNAANSSPLRFIVDVSGAAAEAPDWEVTLVEKPGTAEETASLLAASDGTDATVKAIGSSAWAIKARLLTRFPATALPAGYLETTAMPLTFSAGLASAPIAGPTGEGRYTLRLASYTTGAGFAVPAREYEIRLDLTAPSVVDVSSPDANDVYGIGDDITVLVAFSEPVTVVGSPRLELELNTSGPVYAAYDSGSGGDTLSFLYSVAEGHQSADLDYKSSASLSPNGGSIKDAAGNDAALTLPAPGTVHSLGHNKAIVIDGSAETPEAATVVAVGSSKADGSYKAGVAIPIAVEFSAPVTVTGSPALALNAGTGASAAIVAGQAFPRSSVEFRYVVAAGHQSADLDYSSAGALALNGGSIKGDGDGDAVLTLPAPGTAGSLGHGRAIVVDTTRPVIVAVCYEKSVLATGRVKLLLKLTFSERVFVMTGWLPWLRAGTVLSPRGAPDVRFGYLRGSGGWTLEFGSTLPAGTTWPTAPAPAGLRITLEVVSGYVRDEAKNDAALRFQADLACSCPETPHCVKPIVCKLPEGCLAPVACKLPEYCKTPVFCKLPEACQFPEGCVLPEACKAPVSCKIPEYCKFPLTDGCGLPVNCPGLVGACKGMVDPIPFDPSQTGYPPELDELLRRADGLASEGGGAALDAFMASGDYAERLARLDPASRRAAAAQLDAIRKELG